MEQNAVTMLGGDWTLEGIGRQVANLTELRPEEKGTGSHIMVDCGAIERIDLSGFQLLHVWLNCMRIKGLEPELVNLPESMQESLGRLGLMRLFESSGHEA